MGKAVPDRLSQRGAGFIPSPVLVRFVVGKGHWEFPASTSVSLCHYQSSHDPYSFITNSIYLTTKVYFYYLLIIFYFLLIYRCATSRKVTGSIPGHVIGDFFRGIRQVHVPGVDSAFRNEYQDILGGKGGRCVGLTTLPP
jgi:hypothetical protein